MEAAVVGNNIASRGRRARQGGRRKVYAIEAAGAGAIHTGWLCDRAENIHRSRRPKLVLLPHTYQVRDFAPKLAAKLGAALVSDAVGCRFEGGKLLFTRQMFQGKYAADISVAGDGPWFASFQSGAYRADQAEAGSAPVETVSATTGTIRTHPEAPFKEAQAAVDLTQAAIIVSVGRGIKEQKNIEIAQALADALGGELRPRGPSATRAGCRWSGRWDRADRP